MLDYVVQLTRDATRITPEYHERLRAAAEQTKIPMTELALAWVLHRPGITSVLVGARNVDQIDQALRASALRVPGHVFADIGHAARE